MWCFFQNANYIFYFYFHNASVKGGKIMETNISTVQVVLMGLITVFVGLICLIVIIKILGLIMEKVAKKQPAPAVAPAAAAPAAAPAPAVSAQNNQQIVAAIAVAIAEEMGTDVSHIRIHSIKRV